MAKKNSCEAPRNYRRWDKGEVEVLRELYPDSPIDEVMTALPGRTKAVIRHKACRLGVKATKRKLSESHKRKNLSAETKRKMSEALKGRYISEKWRQKIAEALRGRQFSEEHKQKLSEAQKGEKHHFYGKHLSVEHRRKLSEANKGNKPWNTGHPPSEETKRKLSEVLTGRRFSEEHRRNLSENNSRYWKGKHHSEETKQKISDAQKGEKHHNWKNGSSFEPYSPDFNEKLKREIRERDNHICQICDTTREESVKKHHQVLSVHHIDGDKKNSDKKNLVTLCNPCNTKIEYLDVRPQFGMISDG